LKEVMVKNPAEGDTQMKPVPLRPVLKKKEAKISTGVGRSFFNC
jgi:hypothetical protein